MSTKEKRRRRRWPWVVGLGLAFVLILGTASARIFLNGRRLAALVEEQLNQRIQGRVAVESIDWELRDLPALLTGGAVELTFREVEVWSSKTADAEKLIDVDQLTATLDAGAAMLGRHDLLLANVHLDGGAAMIRQVRQPYPVHEYDTHTISLAEAFRSPEPPRFRAGFAVRPSLIIELADYTLENVTLDFAFPDASFSAHVEGARATGGSLRFDGTDPLAGPVSFELSPEADRATVTLVRGDGGPPLTLGLTELRVATLRQRPSQRRDETTLEYVATTQAEGGARIAVDGKLDQSYTDIFGGEHDLEVKASRFGALLGRLSGGLAGGGDDLALTFAIDGPGLAPSYRAQLQGLALAVPLASGQPPLALEVARLTASWNDATSTGALENTVATGAGGEVHLAATFNRKPDTADVTVEIARPLELAPWLPARVGRRLGSTLSGRLHGFGTAAAQRIDGLDLRLGQVHVTGGLHRGQDGRIHPDGLEVALGGTAARRITGVVDGTTGDLALDFVVESTDLARWLRVLDQPALARTLSGRVHLEGNRADLAARASLTAGGVPLVGRVEAEVGYRRGEVDLHEVQSSALGGWLRGSGKVLFGGAPRLAAVEAQGVNLDLAKLPGVGGLLSGEVDVTASAEGPLAAPRGQAVASVKSLTIAGEPYRDIAIELHAAAGEPIALRAALERVAGGELSLDARYDPRGGDLGGVLDLRKLPLEALAALAGTSGLVGGRLDAALALSGTLAAPTADGTIAITKGWFKEAFLGSAGITLERTGDGRLRVTGQMFQGRVAVDGVIATRAPFAAELSLRLSRLELDLFAPELATRFGLRGWISGEVGFRGDLSLAQRGKLDVTATLTEAVVVIDDDAGGASRLRIENRTPIALAFDGHEVRLLRDVVLRGPTGDVTVSGRASAEQLALKAHGTIAVGLLAPYVRQYFDSVTGALRVEVSVTGSPAAPRLAGVAEIDAIELQPTGQDTKVRIPGGKIELDGDQVSLTGLSMVVFDEFSADDKSELTIAGGIRLDGHLRPAMWGIQIDGQLDGKMLLVLAPQAFSSGYGSADLSIALLGAGRMPDIDGSLEFSPESPLTFVPRGARREVALTDGVVRFTDQLIELGAIGGTVDDEGTIERLEGEISLADWKPVDVDVTLDASGLPVRIPDQLDLTVNLRGLSFVGDAGGLDIGGTIEIPDGRYIKKFNLLVDAIKPVRATSPSPPIWETIPLIGDARLDLTIAAQAFEMKNNLGTIAMSGQVAIGGSPRAPRFDGVIRVDSGAFKLQFIRPRFERAGGSVTFSPQRGFPFDTPTLDLHAEADYRDSTGQVHLIHLSFKGTLETLNWNLRTESGLDHAQTMQLVLAGRTPDQVREALGDNAIGKAGGLPDAQAERGGGFVYADQFVKDLSGDFLSLVIGDTIQNAVDLDVFRLQVGTGAIGLRVEKRITPSVGVKGNLEQGLRGWAWDLSGEFRYTDELSLEAKHEQRVFDDEALEDQQNTAVQGTWRWVLLP